MKLRGQVVMLATVIGSWLALAEVQVDPVGALTAVGLALVLMGHMQAEHDGTNRHTA